MNSTSKNTGNRKILCVKCGGRAASEGPALNSLVDELSGLSKEYAIVFIHGGGEAVSSLSRRLGLEPVFKDGIRQTSPPEMEAVDMVLGGKVNTFLVRRFAAAGAKPVGLTGCDSGTFTGTAAAPESRTGRITEADPGLILDLLERGYIPIVASTSMDRTGEPLNINADEAALEIACRLKAWTLLFLSDIPGILKDGAPLSVITPSRADKEIAEGVITGGMIPKVTSSCSALAGGVGRVIIGRYLNKGDLKPLLDGKLGTALVPDSE